MTEMTTKERIETCKAIIVKANHIRSNLNTLDSYAFYPLASELSDLIRLFYKDFNFSTDGILNLIPENSWFHWSHLEFKFCPTVTEHNLPWNNPSLHIDGKPVNFSVSYYGNTKASEDVLALSIVTAIFGWHMAVAIIELAKLNNRNYCIQTGSGPIMVDGEGNISYIPNGYCLKRDGVLVEKKHINDKGVELEEDGWYLYE